ncbi:MULTISPECIES: GNAT family protein [Pseudomonas]|uniref:GNAT family acetyltransferase n=2 Tax=Pseudomonadaceae TaxID=135621 RepID=A0A0D0JMM5_9PSED|nr:MULTISPECIES: GNAT family protein [Pseudomonas]KIP96633.1 GNAT family acetyltransferase [Pseudomonas fulva]MCW2291932.1 RimJ/RimL family protein N-acetyltransferase [Pseudomonas sp. BIGb0408]NYH73497.1 RimJ/RimL family protein N-acetyltransferase [Pseudomonas flavescens]
MTDDTLLDWTPVSPPPRSAIDGRYVCLEPLDAAAHGDDLWEALQGVDSDPALWDYLPYGPFAERAGFDAWLQDKQSTSDPLFFSVIDKTSGRAVGLLSFLRIAPADGCIEIGHIAFGHAMQRSPASTEAIWLLMSLAMDDLGNRRLEWKCNARNARSLRAAERLGFVHEGLFRQHAVIKGQNRDTAWFSIIDSEWPQCRDALQRWLSPDNFDEHGKQRQRLEALRAR